MAPAHVGVTLTFFSVQLSDKPADDDHTYGHGKFENLSAFGEAGLMAISCAWIVWEAMQRIIRHTIELHHSIWPVLVLLLSIAVDYWRSRRLRDVAERHLVHSCCHWRTRRELGRYAFRHRLARLR